MIPPKFDDLGKEAKDLINKNFHFGVIKLEGKTKTKNGVVSHNYYYKLFLPYMPHLFGYNPNLDGIF